MTEVSSPTEAARNALAAGAAEMAESRLRRELRSRLPRVLHPLIPGEGGTVKEAAEREAKRAASRMLTNLVWSLFFFVLFAGIIGVTVLFLLGIAVYIFLSL